ncbi:MAG TPA: glucosamine-6-phosphate deaminase [Terriglobales bacterium]|nr:glucosamine-6-phosphate deaminase [Terriglobales bacterium]
MGKALETKTVDRMTVRIFESNQAVGESAADDFEKLISPIVASQGHAAVIFASANSQLTFFSSLLKRQIEWAKISIFHMDEYLGITDQHPASFSRFIREKLVNFIQPAAFYPLRGDVSDVDAELKRYADLMQTHSPDLSILGVGENGHLAFNDPPADFKTTKVIHAVNLDLACRKQQVGEGHFAILDDVPKHALSLTVPALLAPKHVLAIVPERRKAEAVKAALEGPVSPQCPASILRTRPNVTLYLDQESVSLLQKR